MKNLILLTLLFVFQISNSQTLRAKIVDENNEPLTGTSVYFDGTTRGVITDLEGYFNIKVPSKLSNPTLVITYLGYKSLYIKDVDSLLPIYQLEVNSESLKDANVYTTLFTRKQMERVFKKYFLGKGKSANQSKILNLDDISLYYVGDENTLYASSLEPIEVENKYLGYNIKFDLVDFEVKYRKKTLDDYFLKQTYYAGSSFFQDVNRNKYAKRYKVYESSLSNYFRNLIDSTLYKTDYKLSYKGLIKNSHDVFEVIIPKDPEVNFIMIEIKSDYIKLVNGQYTNTKFLLEHDRQQTTIMMTKPYFRVDRLGNLIDIKHIVISGDLADDRVSKMLPINYQFLD